MTAMPAPRRAPEPTSDAWSDLETSMRRRFSDVDIWSIRAAVDAVRAEYANARVRAYIPILAERDAVDRLRGMRSQRSRVAG
jgi:hypothetical protein